MSRLFSCELKCRKAFGPSHAEGYHKSMSVLNNALTLRMAFTAVLVARASFEHCAIIQRDVSGPTPATNALTSGCLAR